jgi:hypothetical protein
MKGVGGATTTRSGVVAGSWRTNERCGEVVHERAGT